MKYTDHTYPSGLRLRYWRLWRVEIFWHTNVPKGRMRPGFMRRWARGDLWIGPLVIAWRGLAS